MGLEGVNLGQLLNQVGCMGWYKSSLLCDNYDKSQAEILLDGDNNLMPVDLLLQAQMLLRKSTLYEEINAAMVRARMYQPYGSALSMTGLDDDDGQYTHLYRDAAVNNLRFFKIFYGYQSSTFTLAVNILDRLLSKVKANSKYISCIATSCFYMAVKENESLIPKASELVKLSQCGGTEQDLFNMERCICEKLDWQVKGVTSLYFLKLFHKLVAMEDEDDEDDDTWNILVASLEVIMCRHEFTKYRMETVALALVSYKLQDLGFLNTAEKFSTVVEAQFYCQIGDAEMIQCRGLIKDYMEMYERCPSRLPRLQLSWSVSSRTLRKMKPSTKVLSDLAPIMEDEDDNGNDAGLFDSENEDSELERQIRMMRIKSQQPKLCVEQLQSAGPSSKELSNNNNNNYLTNIDDAVGISTGQASA